MLLTANTTFSPKSCQWNHFISTHDWILLLYTSCECINGDIRVFVSTLIYKWPRRVHESPTFSVEAATKTTHWCCTICSPELVQRGEIVGWLACLTANIGRINLMMMAWERRHVHCLARPNVRSAALHIHTSTRMACKEARHTRTPERDTYFPLQIFFATSEVIASTNS